jgi:hypothetical protein
MRAVPLFSYTLAFALQLRKSTENLSQGSLTGITASLQIYTGLELAK